MTLLDLAYPYLKAFITSLKKRKIWISSRQLGKSWSIAFLLCMKALSKQNGLGLCISTGARSASEIISKCKLFAEAVKKMSGLEYTAGYDHVTFSNGSRVMSLPGSTDGANLRGWSSLIVCVDEAAFIPHLDSILQAISPTLSRDPNAELVFTTTPAGKNGKFYEIYLKALDDKENWYVLTTTIHDAIKDGLNIDLKSLHTLCPDPEAWKQEYECLFVSEYGSLIDTSLLLFIVDTPKGDLYFLGMDIGRTSDRSAISIVKTIGDVSYLEDVVMLNKMPYQEQFNVVKQLHEKYHFRFGHIDSGGIGSAFAEQVERQICSNIKGLLFSATSKVDMFEWLRSRIFDRKLFFKEELSNLVKTDFQNVERVVNEAGQVRYVAGRDSNGHSDFTSSLVLALEACHKHPTNFQQMQTVQYQSLFGGYSSLF